MAIIRLIAATIMLLASGTVLYAQAGLSGRVFDAETGAPLAGASVQVMRGDRKSVV